MEQPEPSQGIDGNVPSIISLEKWLAASNKAAHTKYRVRTI